MGYGNISWFWYVKAAYVFCFAGIVVYLWWARRLRNQALRILRKEEEFKL